MSGDTITPKDLELSAMRAWKERALEAERKLLDYEGKEMLYSGRTELAAFRKREPFVQDVLVKHDALTQCVLHGDGDCENEDAALFEALEKLRKWSPT